MGIIKVDGIAGGSYRTDIIEISVCFFQKGNEKSALIRKVVEDCEKMLELLNGLGVDLSTIQNKSIRTDFRKYNDDKYTVEKCISFATDDLYFAESILRMIHDYNFSASYNTQCILSKEKEIHKELLARALEDSREKAEIIAQSTNSTITKIKEVKFGDFSQDDNDCGEYRLSTKMKNYESKSLPLKYSNNLSMPLSYEEESVEVEWYIE